MNAFSDNEGLLGKFPSLSAAEIVRTALKALENGRAVKIPGWLNRVLVLQNHLLPRVVVRWMMGKVAKAPTQAQPPR